MRIKLFLRKSLAGLLLSQGFHTAAFAHGEAVATPPGPKPKPAPQCQLLTADRLFDGVSLRTDAALLLRKNKVKRVGTRTELRGTCPRRIALGDATLLPGFIESHAHATFQNVSSDVVLRHGITTVRDVGGPLLAPRGGQGELRLLSAGPILQPPGGYPLNVFGGGPGGYDQVGIPVNSPAEAEAVVQHLAEGGANLIKIALEPGGEAGAPWAMDHGHGAPPPGPWPLLPLETVKAVVAKAHTLGKRVAAHVGENEGAKRALDGGVDEWAHVPCAALDDALLERAVAQGVKVVSTIDTLSSCAGIFPNTMKLAALMRGAGTGSEWLYGSEIGHDNVPWGINAQELHVLLHAAGLSPLEIFRAATSKAGENLGLAPLGQLAEGAPADVIAVRGNPFERFKPLEYPDLVISGGRPIVNNFRK